MSSVGSLSVCFLLDVTMRSLHSVHERKTCAYMRDTVCLSEYFRY
jgi:hypothetical protein